METKPDKQQTVTRLALCVVVAVALYAAAGKVPPLEPYRPWLEVHKVQAIAITAAILFGLSLLLFPPEEGGAEPAAPERSSALELYRNSGSSAAPMRPASLPRAARTSRVRWRLLRA